MDNIKTELKIYEFAVSELEKLKITPIWALTDHIGFLKHTIEKLSIQEACTHEVTYTEDISVHRRPRTRECCTVCNKTIKEY